MSENVRVIRIGPVVKEPKPIPIEEQSGKEIIPGMFIAEVKNLHERFRVVHGDGYRDGLVVCLDDCGHTRLVPAWDGKHVIMPSGCPKYRVAYGKTAGGPIKVSKEYFYSEDNFKSHYAMAHFWYVEILRGTVKFVEDAKPC